MISSLLNGIGLINAASSDRFTPLQVSTCVEFNNIKIIVTGAEGITLPSQYVSTIGSLLNTCGEFIPASANGFAPLKISGGIKFADVIIITAGSNGKYESAKYESAIGSL